MAFKKILFIPTADGLDRPGVRALLALARSDSELEVFEPVYSTDLQDYAVVDGATYERARDELVQRRLKGITSLADQLEASGLKSSATAAWDHPLHEAIIRRVLSTKPDLVITEPIEASAGALSNGVWRLASKCPAPLLLVRRGGAGNYEKITAAVDPFQTHAKLAELDASIIQCAKQIQSLVRGEIQVVNCFTPVTDIVPGLYSEHLPIDDVEESLEAYRQDVLNKLVEDAGLQTSAAKLLKGKPSDALRALVEEGKVDLLVMGGVSWGRVRDFVLGNTAKHILYHTDVDILLVKPPGFETTAAEQMSEDVLTKPIYFHF